MKTTLIFLVVAAIFTTFVEAELLEAQFITRLDHSRAQDLRTVSFTYHANLDHYEHGGPFYINIKDVNDASTRWIEDSLMVDIAATSKAALFTFDNRYYGTNIPTDTLTLDDLQFLEFDQMLADISMFIRHLHVTMQTLYFDNDVILYGAGTGGTLAAWARKKFPHLVDGAWSSSGIFEIALSSFRALDALEYTLYQSNYTLDCRMGMSRAFNELDALILSDSIDRIVEVLNLCDCVDTDDVQEVAFLYQTHYNFIMRHLDEQHLPGLNRLCSTVENLNAGESDLEAFGRWLNEVHGNDCRDTDYDNFVETLSDRNRTSPAALSGARQSFYLQCSQSALFQITDNFSWVPNRIEFAYHEILCRSIFGEEGFDFGGVRWANLGMLNSFGSLDQRITNMLYTNGELDPFTGNGISYTFEAGSAAYNIANYAKSADFPAVQDSDTENLLITKRLIREMILWWHGIEEE